MSNLEKAYQLFREKKYAESSAVLNTLLNECERDSAQADRLLHFLGLIELEKENYGLARILFQQALSLNPVPATYNNLGICHEKLGFAVESREYFEKAIERAMLNNEDNEIDWYKSLGLYFANLGSVYVGHGNPEKAIALSKRALELINLYNDRITEKYKTEAERKKHLSRYNMRALWNIALASLERGDYEQGFKLYDAGFDVELGKLSLRHYPKIQLWKGEKCKTLLVYGDQGLGDEIMHASLINRVKQDHNIILECHPRLTDLFKQSFPDIPVYPTRKTKDTSWTDKHDIDAAVSMCLLYKHYVKTEKDFNTQPYLKANPALVKKYAKKLNNMSDRLKVGISWAGGTNETGKKYRQLPLELLEFMLEMEVDLISLQYTPDAEKDVKWVKDNLGGKIHHWQDVVDDYDRTAALVSNLDLVISVPQSVVHLAGASGTKTLQLCPKYSMWQCGVYGQNPPFYSCVENIWQDEPGNWEPVVAHAEDYVAELISERLHEERQKQKAESRQ